uniref:Uncharacterized protein n=1 Tax=Physcomitrium patens TaxID=3218 RepID=A0A7I3ZP22_PHYPA
MEGRRDLGTRDPDTSSSLLTHIHTNKWTPLTSSLAAVAATADENDRYLRRRRRLTHGAARLERVRARLRRL